MSREATIQGLYALDPEGKQYGSLLGKVLLGNLRAQQKVSPVDRLNHTKDARLFLAYCRDCGAPHQTGSQIWFECPVDHNWRTSMDTCVYPTKRVNEK